MTTLPPLSASATADPAAVQAFPNARKIYQTGSRPDIRVPFREIAQHATPDIDGDEPNPPITVYDTSGPYTDPDIAIDIRKGLAEVRTQWIDERDDTERLPGPSSAFGHARRNDPATEALRFDLKRSPRRAQSGRNVTQMHYARQGIITPEMEYVAIRENLRRDAYLDSLKALGPKGERMYRQLTREHAGAPLGASIPATITPEFVRDEIARAGHYSGQYQPPRA